MSKYQYYEIAAVDCPLGATAAGAAWAPLASPSGVAMPRRHPDLFER